METSTQCTQCPQCEQLKQDVMDLLVLCEKLREMLEEAEKRIDELNGDSNIDTQFYCPNCGYEWGCVLGKPGKEFWHCLRCHVSTSCFIRAKGDKAHEACVEVV